MSLYFWMLLSANTSCAEIQNFAKTAHEKVAVAREKFHRLKEVVDQARASSLGSHLSSLDVEAAQLKGDYDLFVKTEIYKDLEEQRHFFLRDGERFTIQVVPLLGGNSYIKSFTFDPIGGERMIGGVGEEFEIKASTSLLGLLPGFLTIDGISLGSPTSDQISTDHANISAVAIAQQINSQMSSPAKITAEAEPVHAELKVDLEKPGVSFRANALKINGVGVFGNAKNANDLALLINRFSFETGVVASVPKPAPKKTNTLQEEIFLDAKDGRNISVQVGLTASMKAVFGAELGGNKNIFYGKIRIRGLRPFKIKADSFAIFGFVGEREVVASTENYSQLSLATPEKVSTASAIVESALNLFDEREMVLDEMLRFCR